MNHIYYFYSLSFLYLLLITEVGFIRSFVRVNKIALSFFYCTSGHMLLVFVPCRIQDQLSIVVYLLH